MPYNISPTLVKATLADYPTIQNMARFYVYDMSHYCGFLPGWECPADGLYECFDLKPYFIEPDRHPFLIKVNEELTGFVMINKISFDSLTDWNIGEFFVLGKFQKHGVGKVIAYTLFHQFKGTWEVKVIPENVGPLKFWEHIITSYTKGKFTKNIETISEPTPRTRIVFQFKIEK